MADFKALIVILSLALPVFWIAKRFACEFSTLESDFILRRNLWIAITVLAFVSHNFWVYVGGAMFLLAFSAWRDSNRLALFLALMMAVPSFGVTIPGFGGIQQILHVNHLRLLSAMVLLPAYLAIRGGPGVLPFGRTAADKCLIAFVLLQLMLQFSVSSITALMRYSIYSFLEVFLPYYVASRGLRDLKSFRDTLMALVFAVVLITPLAIFEFLKHWLLYTDLATSMGVNYDMGTYMSRGDSVRVQVSASHSIALGYIVTIALALLVFVRRYISNRGLSALALTLLIATLVATGARGPLVGSLTVLAIMLATGSDKIKRMWKTIFILLPLVFALSFTDFGQKFLDTLPFLGTVDSESVDYRRRLFDISMFVVWQNPFFGAFDYLVNPSMQELIQGEGIIDVVNTFLGVALTYGFVGLSLFCGVFAFSGWSVWRVIRMTDPASEINLLGRSLLAALGGALVTIVTVSSISFIPWMYWIIAGLCVGYSRLIAESAALADTKNMQFGYTAVSNSARN